MPRLLVTVHITRDYEIVVEAEDKAKAEASAENTWFQQEHLFTNADHGWSIESRPLHPSEKRE